MMKSSEKYGDSHSRFFAFYYFCFVIFLTILYTYPLIFNLKGMFYGFPWDSLGGIWSFWWLKFSYVHEIPLNVHTYIAYPFGHDSSHAPFPYLLIFLGFITTFITNEVVAFNILKLISFPTMALTTYLLVYYLTNHRVVSAIVGLIYAFSPFYVIHSMAHFTNGYWLSLAVLFLLKFLREGGYRNSVLFGFFGGITFVDNAYYAYFIGLLTPVFVLVSMFNQERRDNILRVSFLKFYIVSFLIFLLVIFPMMYPMFKGMVFSQGKQIMEIYGFKRTFSGLFIFSAKPLDYLLPSKYNLFFGGLVPDLGMSPLKGHRYTEHTLYLGYSLLLLGGYAFYCVAKRRGQLSADKEGRHMLYLFFAVAVSAVILSAPPFIPLGDYRINLETREIIAAYKIYLPQYFAYKFFPMFMTYARMGAIVLLAVCVMAAFGLREILARINTPKMRYIALSLFSLIIFIEYAEFPTFRLTKVKEPEVYKWMASQSDHFSIVEYPLGAGDDPYTTYEYYFYQRIHGKYLVNGAQKGTTADKFRMEIIDISNPETIDKLSGIGVRYILIHKDKYIKGNETVLLDWLTKPPRDKIFPVEYNDGKVPDIPMKKLRLVKYFGDVAVYEPIKNY